MPMKWGFSDGRKIPDHLPQGNIRAQKSPHWNEKPRTKSRTDPPPRPPALAGSARPLAEVRAGKAAAHVHGFDKAAEIAQRVKDATALEGALIGKLDSERDFAGQYMALFPHGVRLDHRDDSTVASTKAAEWCLGHGFHIRTVQRWCELLDPAIYVERKNAILKRCWELAELWQAANFSSASNEWYTPARYIE